MDHLNQGCCDILVGNPNISRTEQQWEIFLYLMQQRADIGLEEDGEWFGFPHWKERLVREAALEIRDRDGNSLMHFATLFGFEELGMKRGGNPWMRNDEAVLPVELLKKEDNDRIEKMKRYMVSDVKRTERWLVESSRDEGVRGEKSREILERMRSLMLLVGRWEEKSEMVARSLYPKRDIKGKLFEWLFEGEIELMFDGDVLKELQGKQQQLFDQEFSQLQQQLLQQEK